MEATTNEKKESAHTEMASVKRGLKERHVQLIAMGGLIGTCYFLGAGNILLGAGPASFIAFLFGGIIVYLMTYCLGELACAMPVTGSFINYAHDLISPTWACGLGWAYYTQWVVYIPAEMIAVGVIMNTFFPAVPQVVFAVTFGLLLMIVNTLYVGTFGELEFWLALIKIVAIVVFIFFALLIVFGLIGNNQGHFIGWSTMFGTQQLDNGDGTSTAVQGLLPFGFVGLIGMMSLIVNNYLGSELIGLAAGESKDPEKTIPKAVRSVTFRIVAMFVIPMFLVCMIFPWTKADATQGSVFADALTYNGLPGVGIVLSLVVIAAGISCANSGIYGSTRALYGMSSVGMAPKWMGALNKNGVPRNAIFVAMIPAWIAMFFYYRSDSVYLILCSMSGFTGLLYFIIICWCQYKFRSNLKRLGVDTKKVLKFTMPGFPYLTLGGIVVMLAIMVSVFSSADLRISAEIGLPVLIIPMILYKLFGKNGKLYDYNVYEEFLARNNIKNTSEK